MAAITDCNKAIKNMGSNDGADELQQLMKLTEQAVNNTKQAHASPRVHTAQTLENENRRITINMTKYTPLTPRVTLTAVTRMEMTARMPQHDLPLNNQMLTKIKVRRRRHAQARPTVSNSATAYNTQSQTRMMTTAVIGTRPITRFSKRMS